MRNIIKVTLAVVFAGVLFSGCTNDGYSVDNWAFSYGTVVTKSGLEGATNNYDVLLDNGSMLYVKSNMQNGTLFENNDRVEVYFTVWDDIDNELGGKDYFGRLNRMNKLLSKAPVKLSEIEENEELNEELGNDQLKVTTASFSGRYINVSFEFAGSYYPPTPHFINVVHDDIEVVDGTAVITMRHNGYDDVPSDESQSGYCLHPGFVSFDISSLLPEGEDEVEVKLVWYEYGSMDNGEQESESDTKITTDSVRNEDESGDVKDGEWWNQWVEKSKTGTFKYTEREFGVVTPRARAIQNLVDKSRPDPSVNNSILH